MAITIPDATLTFTGNTPIVIDGITPSTLAKPAIATYNGNIYVLFTTSNPDAPSIWQVTLDAARQWQGNTGVSFGITDPPQAPASLSTPALAELDGTLYMAYINQPYSYDTNGYIQIAGLTAPSGDTSPLPSSSWVFFLSQQDVSDLPLADAGGLAMLAVEDKLWVFYSSNKQLYLAVGSPDTTTSNVVWESVGPVPVLNATMKDGPAAAWLANTNFREHGGTGNPVVIYRGTSDDRYQYVGYDINTNTYYGPWQLPVQGNSTYIRSEVSPCITALLQNNHLGVLLFKGEQGTSINASLYVNGLWCGSYALQLISKHVGTEINPTTNYGVAAVAENQELNEYELLMVYPSASSSNNMDLWWAAATVTVTQS